ncbi:Glyoxalase/bleomycin resistance protein/dioxygenase [Rippkaea orientalis PCC 8801]|uniref:Glyoxalase/bleomycin resistance protein/dioxygenase n=1 Tax=Rippkaea orientalis (strain PCC 8801 / RF-1) TaxID=41431 RepID=B7JUR1_RIPO1|nr:VOC family protein [Rippkaea orientalis]ACK65605.1 Glyoxalase/bleomycin resistance protein/dioxygenase [Rippkaea orientalis PCC 8801]
MSDLGLTHIALEVTNIDKSITFYQKYASMKIVHRRVDETTQVDVAWISDLTRPFVIVLVKTPQVNSQLVPNFHLGVALKSRELVDAYCQQALAEGILIDGPNDWGSPVGYWAYLRDPDGHTLEISFGQQIQFTLEQS